MGRRCQKYTLHQKKIEITVVRNWISYKKVCEGISLSPPWSGARVLERFPSLKYNNVQKLKVAEHRILYKDPSFTFEGDKRMPPRTFRTKFNGERLLFECFFMLHVFLAASIHKVNLLSRFYILLASPGKLCFARRTKPPAPPCGEVDIRSHGLFVWNSTANDFYLNVFLMRRVVFAMLIHTKWIYFPVFTRLCSRREVMCLVVVYVRTFVCSFVPSFPNRTTSI